MTLQFAKSKDVTLHYEFSPGAAGARPVVFLNSLGTDFRIWQGVANRLTDIPILMTDKRGHGLSDMGATSIEILANDVADLMDRLALTDAVICGVSIGGMIAQVLAVQRPDLVAGLVLCNTGARIGDADGWNARITAINASGLEPMADAVMARWFSTGFRDTRPTELAGYRNMFTRTSAQGYVATCAAIRDADLSSFAERITVPTICVAGSEDQATPAELVAALSEMIKDSTLEVISGVGHLPCIEAPEVIAKHVNAIWKVSS